MLVNFSCPGRFYSSAGMLPSREVPSCISRTEMGRFAMKRRNEAGQSLVFVAVGLLALLGFVGLGIDMGVLRYERRLQQSAADGAAIAGATNLAFGGVGTGAQNAAASNGFT